jgi:hypothetical protein
MLNEQLRINARVAPDVLNPLKYHDSKELDRVRDQFAQCFESLVHRIELTCTMVSVISTMDADNLHVYRPTLYVCVARKTMVHPDLYHASAHFAHVLKSLDHASKSLVHRIGITCT